LIVMHLRRALVHGFVALCLSLLLALSGCERTAPGEVLVAQGEVIKFDDGDSFELKLDTGATVQVRLHAVDAPELVQRHGRAARNALMAAVAGRPLHVDCYKRDARGRFVCRAQIGGEDLQLLLLQAGHAWHFTRFAEEQTRAERQRYGEAMAAARTARIGLWSVDAPQPPWDCRDKLRGLQRCE
jgi:endonuclease YncB( thermonuclease family)